MFLKNKATPVSYYNFLSSKISKYSHPSKRMSKGSLADGGRALDRVFASSLSILPLSPWSAVCP